jgi:predicted RNase H-like HicB family nuclease
MAECHRYPLRVQQSKLDGWWFIFVDEVPGLGVLGPIYEDLLDRLKVVAGEVFRARGETVTDIKIIPSERPALQVLRAGTDVGRRGTPNSLQSLGRAPFA